MTLLICNPCTYVDLEATKIPFLILLFQNLRPKIPTWVWKFEAFEGYLCAILVNSDLFFCVDRFG